jgi:thioredoxin 1
MKSLLFILSISGLLGTASGGFAQEVLRSEAFAQRLRTEQAPQLLDVRTPDEFSAGHLAGATRADWRNPAEFAQQTARLDKNRPVYVYCQVGGRSKSAAEWLVRQGFRAVYDLQGGYRTWVEQQEPHKSPLPKPEKP